MTALLALALLPSPAPACAADLARFRWCPAAHAKAQWEFGCRHLEWLERVGGIQTEWHADALWCRRCWDLLDDCLRIHPHDDGQIAGKLTELRRLLDDDDWRAGRMPPPGPLWRFRDRY